MSGSGEATALPTTVNDRRAAERGQTGRIRKLALVGAGVIGKHHGLVISQLADRVSILSDGRVVESGEIHQILARPTHAVTAGLVGSYTRTALTDAERAVLSQKFTGRRISIVVDDALVDSPVLSRIARAHGVDFSIIQGGVARVKDQPYGQLSLALYGDDTAIDRFSAELGAQTEVTPW